MCKCVHTEERLFEDKRESGPSTKLAETLILDFWPPELWENNFFLFKVPNPWYNILLWPSDLTNTDVKHPNYKEESTVQCFIINFTQPTDSHSAFVDLCWTLVSAAITVVSIHPWFDKIRLWINAIQLAKEGLTSLTNEDNSNTNVSWYFRLH